MMKQLFFGMFTMMAVTAYAGNDGERITQAIQNANTTELASMFNSSIELVTPSSSGISTKEQARIVLDNFFRNNLPVKATLVHETNGTTNSMMVISLITRNGTFRISIVGTNKAGVFTINEFKIN